jgi:hypothetical protein
VLAVLFVVLIIVCIRQFAGGSGPNEVVAAPEAIVAIPVSTPVITSPTPVSEEQVEPPPVDIPTIETIKIAGMPRDLSRNLFTTREWRSFRPSLTLVQAPSLSKKRNAKSSLWSAACSAIVESQRDQHREFAETEKILTSMQLQSTMTGSLPMAYISGRLVREGEVIDGFSVVQISERRVVVRKGMHLHELAMP